MNSRFQSISAPILGGYSLIEHVRDSAAGIDLAIKRPRNDKPGSLEHWQRERECLTILLHPNIIKLHASGEDEIGPFMALEWVAGGSLAAKIDKQPLDEISLTLVLKHVLEALIAVHTAGYAHADVNASNLLTGTGGRVVLIDFGNAWPLHNTYSRAIDAANIGSVHHMAPELFAGSSPTLQTDLYALGVMACHALTGRFPFDGDTQAQVITGHLRMEPVLPTAPPWSNWLRRLLSRKPSHRPTTAFEALQSLPLA